MIDTNAPFTKPVKEKGLLLVQFKHEKEKANPFSIFLVPSNSPRHNYV